MTSSTSTSCSAARAAYSAASVAVSASLSAGRPPVRSISAPSPRWARCSSIRSTPAPSTEATKSRAVFEPMSMIPMRIVRSLATSSVGNLLLHLESTAQTAVNPYPVHHLFSGSGALPLPREPPRAPAARVHRRGHDDVHRDVRVALACPVLRGVNLDLGQHHRPDPDLSVGRLLRRWAPCRSPPHAAVPVLAHAVCGRMRRDPPVRRRAVPERRRRRVRGCVGRRLPGLVLRGDAALLSPDHPAQHG